MKISHIFLMVVFVLSFSGLGLVRGAEPTSYEVLPQKAFLYSTATGAEVTKTYLKRGQVLRIMEPAINGFYKVRTNGGTLYVKAQDLRVLDTAEATYQATEDKDESNHRPFAHLTYDLGVSSGSFNSKTYTEALFGVSYFFKEWLAWRNAAFIRFGDQTVFGVDSSVRGIYSQDLSSSLGMTAFAGPGFRFASQWPSAPFIEGGLVLHFSGLSVGLGMKSILNSTVDSKYSNDNQLLIIIGGGGVFY